MSFGNLPKPLCSFTRNEYIDSSIFFLLISWRWFLRGEAFHIFQFTMQIVVGAQPGKRHQLRWIRFLSFFTFLRGCSSAHLLLRWSFLLLWCGRLFREFLSLIWDLSWTWLMLLLELRRERVWRELNNSRTDWMQWGLLWLPLCFPVYQITGDFLPFFHLLLDHNFPVGL